MDWRQRLNLLIQNNIDRRDSLPRFRLTQAGSRIGAVATKKNPADAGFYISVWM
jgi:uncharacterized protein (DUF736 family)